MQSHRRRAALRRCVQVCVFGVVSVLLLETPLWALCSAGGAPTDPPTGNLSWSRTNETTCVANAADCNGRDPETGPDGTVFTFRVVYTEQTFQAPPQAAYLFIDTNGDGVYPCKPSDAGTIASLDDYPTPGSQQWPAALAVVMLVTFAFLALRSGFHWQLRVAASVGLALVASIACGGGGGGGGAAAASGCAQAEAYNLQAFTTTYGAGADLGRQIEMCGKARTMLYIFYVVNSSGTRISGEGGVEQSMDTK
jgi:hypothetical protein